MGWWYGAAAAATRYIRDGWQHNWEHQQYKTTYTTTTTALVDCGLWMVEVEETKKKKLSRFLHLFALVISYGLERSSSSERSLLKRSSSSWSSSTLNNITECEYWVPRERKRRDHNVFYIATKKCCALTHWAIHPSIQSAPCLPSVPLYTRLHIWWLDRSREGRR